METVEQLFLYNENRLGRKRRRHEACFASGIFYLFNLYDPKPCREIWEGHNVVFF